MIQKYAEMSFWSCIYNSKNVCCQSHYTNMATSGCDVYLLLYFMRCVRNVWWFMTHKHPSKQCPACLSTNIVLAAGYATHVWNYIMSSCWKIHDPSLKKHLASYQKVFHANESAESYIYCLEHYVHGKKGYKCRFTSTISHLYGLATFFIFVKMYACWTM